MMEHEIRPENARGLNAGEHSADCSPARGSAKCLVCQAAVEDDDALYVHVYLEHPEVHDNVDKMLKGEPYTSAEELRQKGILPNTALHLKNEA
jgi:hypothetical protein